jgi:hypothetical protein
MAVTYVETRVKGKNFQVPAAEIEGRSVIVRGRWFKIASILDENVTEGELVKDPEVFVTTLQKSGLKADVLTFFQRPPDVKPRFPYPVEWENYAVIPITTFEAWWESLPQEARKNTRRAAKRGVVVKVIPFDDELARGIHRLCNASPVRNGRKFWHYGKDFETVKREHATFLERSEFIGAYFQDELIGFIKIVYVDQLASIMHILALNAHQDKRPMNALVAKAVEVCAQKRVGWFVYGNYFYGNKKDDSLAEFKRRNGFERIEFPRYYVPLTWKGRLFASLKLYRGTVGLLPWPVLRPLLKIRCFLLEAASKPAVAQDT